MATYSYNNSQSTLENRTYTVDYTNDLPTGGTVVGGTAVHTPPSGTALTPTVTYVHPYVYVTLDKPTVTGVHYLDVTATFSDADTSTVRVQINVVHPTATARVGMASLISTLRGMANAGVNDYSLVGVPYWSDAQLQAVLDRYATKMIDESLQAFGAMSTGGAVTYTEYRSQGRFYEATTGGTAIFVIKDSTGAVVPSSGWSADYEKGIITFTADTAGVSYYLTGTTYDIYAAASDVWYQKAGHAAEMIDFATGGHNIKRSHITQLALTMARRYENMASTLVNSSPVEMVRGDMA